MINEMRKPIAEVSDPETGEVQLPAGEVYRMFGEQVAINRIIERTNRLLIRENGELKASLAQYETSVAKLKNENAQLQMSLASAKGLSNPTDLEVGAGKSTASRSEKT